MLRRCKYPSLRAYRWYGAKGIKVCERWKTFENFASDMGPIPFAGATLDRIDSSKDYGPENCKWSTMTTQARNRKSNKLLTLNGETKCLAEWVESSGLPWSTIMGRKRIGWSDEDALTTPKTSSPVYRYNGVTLTLKEWSPISGIPYKTLWHRIKSGWSIEDTLTKPLRIWPS
jgi:hypothetical protein